MWQDVDSTDSSGSVARRSGDWRDWRRGQPYEHHPWGIRRERIPNCGKKVAEPTRRYVLGAHGVDSALKAGPEITLGHLPKENRPTDKNVSEQPVRRVLHDLTWEKYEFRDPG